MFIKDLNLLGKYVSRFLTIILLWGTYFQQIWGKKSNRFFGSFSVNARILLNISLLVYGNYNNIYTIRLFFILKHWNLENVIGRNFKWKQILSQTKQNLFLITEFSRITLRWFAHVSGWLFSNLKLIKIWHYNIKLLIKTWFYAF